MRRRILALCFGLMVAAIAAAGAFALGRGDRAVVTVTVRLNDEVTVPPVAWGCSSYLEQGTAVFYCAPGGAGGGPAAIPSLTAEYGRLNVFTDKPPTYRSVPTPKKTFYLYTFPTKR